MTVVVEEHPLLLGCGTGGKGVSLWQEWLRQRKERQRPLSLSLASPDRRSEEHSRLTSSAVGSSPALYRARGCQRSYCSWS